MNIIFAAIVRIIAERPQLNRFAIKKSLSDDGQETVLKMPFTGNENLLEIKEKMDSIIRLNKENTSENKTDRLANLLNLVPDFLLRFVIRFLVFADKHGFLIKPIIKSLVSINNCYVLCYVLILKILIY